MRNLNTPDVTLVQLIAAGTWIGTELVTIGVIDSGSEKLYLSAGVTVLTAAWTIADSIIRNGRAKMAAAVAVAELHNKHKVT